MKDLMKLQLFEQFKKFNIPIKKKTNMRIYKYLKLLNSY